jgi:hypothetical protein
LTSRRNEGRQAVAEAYDALENWRREIRAAKRALLVKVVDQVTNEHHWAGTDRPPMLSRSIS